jgi:uncharacterized Ntn-hydrolase superfamily protein
VATQANVEASYGPDALDLLAAGAGAEQALSELLAKDPGSHGRQVAVVDARGGVAAHTGERCMAYAGHATGEQVSCQANIMASETVWPAMLEAFESSSGPLAGRLMSALDAAQDAGGDIRGRQSAAILVVPAEGRAWETTISLRVEDHPEPLDELHRLLRLNEAYEIAGHGDALTNEARYDEAAQMYGRACALAPDNHELMFWAGLGSAQSGDVDGGIALVRAAIALQPGWAELLPRLPANVAPAAVLVAKRLGLQAP